MGGLPMNDRDDPLGSHRSQRGAAGQGRLGSSTVITSLKSLNARIRVSHGSSGLSHDLRKRVASAAPTFWISH